MIAGLVNGPTAEDLAIGDTIVTQSGAPGAVKRIGRKTIIPPCAVGKMKPVRIYARALGAGLRHADLTVTADHVLIADTPGRMAFNNYQKYLDLYGAERIIPEKERPRITSGRLLPGATRARLGIGDTELFEAALSA